MYDMYKEYEDQIEKLQQKIQELQQKLKQHEIYSKENDFKMKQLMEDNAKLNAQLRSKVVQGSKPIERVDVPSYDVKVSVQQERHGASGQAPLPAIRATPSPAQIPPQVPPPRPYSSPSSSPTNPSQTPQSTSSISTTHSQSTQANNLSIDTQGQKVLHTAPIITQNMSTGTLTRICPNCGAMGFAIKEVEDKTQIISYVPQKIYAKKKVCTKCFLEF
ncbi:MAG: hypothetical protein JW891_09065 [Candidatus Lokiarchaeota archaeon]|nr:hypothetical protein [Candidatus Lokiarchaeota archaeon]